MINIFVLLIGLWSANGLKVDREYDYKVIRKNDEPIVLSPKGEHKYTFIFLHGLCGSGEGLLDLFANQKKDARITPLNCKIILPTAPVRNVTGREDLGESTSWFDLYGWPISIKKFATR